MSVCLCVAGEPSLGHWHSQECIVFFVVVPAGWGFRNAAVGRCRCVGPAPPLPFDYEQEATNQTRFAESMGRSSFLRNSLRVPTVFSEYTTPRGRCWSIGGGAWGAALYVQYRLSFKVRPAPPGGGGACLSQALQSTRI